jgi:hypothetical protein
MSFKIKGGHSVNEINVSSDGSLNVNFPIGNLNGVTGSTAVEQNLQALHSAGFFIAAGEVDDGSVIGVKTVRPIFVTQDYRTLRNLESPIWNDSFSHSVMNNTKYNITTLGQTVSVISGFTSLNSSDSVTSGDYSLIKTFRTFTIYEAAPIYVSFKAKFSRALQSNSVIEFGVGIISTTAEPTDGIFFRASAGTLNSVCVKNTFVTTEVDIFTIEPDYIYDFLIAVNDESAEFWIDNVLVSKLTPSPLTGGTSLSNSLQLFMRNRNSGVVPAPIQFNVHTCGVLMGDLKLNKGWRTNMSLNGQSSISEPDGQSPNTEGTTTANLRNSLSPSVVVCTNTTPGYTKLGGDFSFVASAGTEDDYVVFSYLNPAGTASIPAKSLIIQSVNIDTYTSGATMGATATLLQWSLGIGSTSSSLSEVDSLDLGTRAARRIGLGLQTIAESAVVGTMASPRIEFKPGLSLPLMVEAGTYFSVLLKIPVGLETSNLLYRGQVTINGYFD